MIKICLMTTTDSLDGQPWPPPSDRNTLWVAVRRAHGCTLWRSITCSSPCAATDSSENSDFEPRQLYFLNECLEKWLATQPEIGEANADLHRFAMQSVARLVHAFVLNDGMGVDSPDFKKCLLERVIEKVGGEYAYNELLRDVANELNESRQ